MSASTRSLFLDTATATEHLGAALWHAWSGETQCVVYLRGDLGAGKTTLVRGLLRAAGHGGPVRSPTYTLIEPYELSGCRVLHLDLYRLGDPEELEFIGLRDELGASCLILVEWPDRGRGAMPDADLVVQIDDDGASRTAMLMADTGHGRTLMRSLADIVVD